MSNTIYEVRYCLTCRAETEHEQVPAALPAGHRWACCNESDHGALLEERAAVEKLHSAAVEKLDETAADALKGLLGEDTDRRRSLLDACALARRFGFYCPNPVSRADLAYTYRILKKAGIFHNMIGEPGYQILLEEGELAEPIEIEVYKPVEGRPGYSEYSHSRTRIEVLMELNKRLQRKAKDLGLELDDGPFSVFARDRDLPWPRYRWIAVFAVTGGSEGHYVHVEAINNNENTRELIYLLKTFQGLEHAYRIAAIAAKELDA